MRGGVTRAAAAAGARCAKPREKRSARLARGLGIAVVGRAPSGGRDDGLDGGDEALGDLDVDPERTNPLLR